MKYPLHVLLTYIFISIVCAQAQNTSNSDSIVLDESIPAVQSSKNLSNKKVYVFEIHDEIGPGATRITASAIESAIAEKADYKIGRAHV